MILMNRDMIIHVLRRRGALSPSFITSVCDPIDVLFPVAQPFNFYIASGGVEAMSDGKQQSSHP